MSALLLFYPLCVALIMCQTPHPQTEQTDPADTVRSSAPDTSVTDSVRLDVGRAYLMGQFDPSTYPDFVEVDTQYADRAGLYLRKETYAAFIRMHDAALREGIKLQIRSATRNFYLQKAIWERKWTGEQKIENGKDASVAFPDPLKRAQMILKYSSMPGSSRHHWGTDIDLNSFENSWFDAGPGLQIYEWLTRHAGEYGFCQPYSKKGPDRPYGYEEERWHWSYMPLSQQFTKMAADSLRDDMIQGFAGAEVAPQLHIVERYVLGINPACMK